MHSRHAAVEIDGDRLRELRQLAGHNLTDFAELAAITAQYVSAIERGDRQRVSPPVFVRICNALGLDDRRELVKTASAA